MRGHYPRKPRPPITAETLLARSKWVGDCLEWQGARTKAGYGRVGFEMREYYTHRLMWGLHHGPIPAGLLIRHTCDNPPCLNPDHLLVGTVADNARDAMERGRVVGSKLKGSQVATAKLTEAQVSEIKRLLRSGRSMTGVGRQFGVSKFPIQQIANGRAWRHVE